MKRRILTATLLVLVLLAGCGKEGNDQTENQTNAGEESQTEKEVESSSGQEEEEAGSSVGQPGEDTSQQEAKTALSPYLDEEIIASLDEVVNDVPMVDTVLPTLDGGEYDTKNARGKVLVMNFMSSWCKYCREELPYFKELRDTFGEDEVELIFVDCFESGDATEEVKAMMEEFGLDVPVLLDKDNSYAIEMGLYGSVPVTFIVDSEGRTVFYMPGAFPERDLLFSMVDYVKNNLHKD